MTYIDQSEASINESCWRWGPHQRGQPYCRPHTVSYMEDKGEPIRGQYSGHVTSLDQSEPEHFCQVNFWSIFIPNHSNPLKFSYNSGVDWAPTKITLNVRKSVFRDWLRHWNSPILEVMLHMYRVSQNIGTYLLGHPVYQYWWPLMSGCPDSMWVPLPAPWGVSAASHRDHGTSEVLQLPGNLL